MIKKPWTGLLLILMAAIHPALPMQAETARIPGDIHRICYYTDFFYNHPPEDFCYYLNDRLLFLEKPDAKIMSNGMRNKLLKILRWHHLIKKSLHRLPRDAQGNVSINLVQPGGFKKAVVVMHLLGLLLEKTKDGYRVSRNTSPGLSEYYRFALLDTRTLTRKLNKTFKFTLQLKESDITIPWDYNFLSEITGKTIGAHNFFETLLEDERFSLLLGVLYRLSRPAVRRIAEMSVMPGAGAWKEIYEDKKFLMGLFVLSHALRVADDGQFILPGGPAAAPFWNTLTETDGLNTPLAFLRRLAVADNGRMNYLFLFSFFLPPDTQTALFTGAAGREMLELCKLVRLNDKESLREDRFPRFRDYNFYTLLYALRTRSGAFHFNPGTDRWLSTIRKNGGNGPAALTDLLRALLARSSAGAGEDSDTRKFVSLYTKFFRRPQLLNDTVLDLVYHKYDDYNVMVDFIEKLPLQKPRTVVKLFEWLPVSTRLEKRDRVLFTSLFQSLLELFSHAARRAPDRYDYDQLVTRLTEIPLRRLEFYQQLTQFFREELDVGEDKTLIDFVTGGIAARVVRVDGTDYRFTIDELYKENIKAILQTQDIATFELLTALDGWLSQVERSAEDGSDISATAARIHEGFHQLPHGEISEDAPKYIRERVTTHDRNRMYGLLGRLTTDGVTAEEVHTISLQLKSFYLLPQLSDYLLGLAYAVNAKNPDLRIFLNSNLVRLHDFAGSRDRTPWNYCGTPPRTDYFSEYHLSGGLSRLSLSMAAKWQDHLFRRTYIHNPAQVQSVLVNVLDLHPSSGTGESTAFKALLVDLGRELLRKGRDDASLRRELLESLRGITAGYHYRKTVDYLTGKAEKHPLFFSEIHRLGDIFFNKEARDVYLESTACGEALKPFTRTPLSRLIARGRASGGGIYYRTFGSLLPQPVRLFPQDVAAFFDNGWVSGEMVDEFKIKLGWELYHHRTPSFLMGHLLYSYFRQSAPRYLSQNHVKDYFSTYFVFDIFNHSHLKYMLKNLKKEGHLRLQ